MRKKVLLGVVLTFIVGVGQIWGQSKDFKLGKWTEIYHSIVTELDKVYVDSLPVDRIYKAGINAMLEDLDPYTVYIPEEENDDLQMMLSKTYGGIGAIIFKEKDGNVIINKPYFNSPAYKYGLVCGDEIIAINGTPTKGLETKESSDMMKGKPGTTVVFTVKKVRTSEVKEVIITRERIYLPDVEYIGMINDTTGYILQTGFTSDVSFAVKEAFLKLKKQGMKRLVLDLRGNGGGLLSEAVNIVGHFVPRGSLVVSSKGLDPKSERKMVTTNEPIDTEIPIIVLVDQASASASEIVSGALQDLDRGVIMGKRTFGKGLVQSVVPIAYNGTLKVTTAKYYTPSGRCVQAIDYSHKNEDGSVGHIPDSLTNEFKTSIGRTVKDGGGITPDIELEQKDYSRLVYSMVLSGVVDRFVLDYVKTHEKIAPLDEFYLSDEDFEAFIEFAKTQDFDYRSSAKTYFDQMRKELKKDGLEETVSSELEAMEKFLEMDKERFIRLKKSELVPFIEEELATRYYYHAGIKVRLRYDDQLKEALLEDVSSVFSLETKDETLTEPNE